jgi:hypothetical protein
VPRKDISPAPGRMAKPTASSAESRQIEVFAFEKGSGRCALNQPVWVVPAAFFAMQSPEEVIRCWMLDVLLLVRHVLRWNFFSRADFFPGFCASGTAPLVSIRNVVQFRRTVGGRD